MMQLDKTWEWKSTVYITSNHSKLMKNGCFKFKNCFTMRIRLLLRKEEKQRNLFSIWNILICLLKKILWERNRSLIIFLNCWWERTLSKMILKKIDMIIRRWWFWRIKWEKKRLFFFKRIHKEKYLLKK